MEANLVLEVLLIEITVLHSLTEGSGRIQKHPGGVAAASYADLGGIQLDVGVELHNCTILDLKLLRTGNFIVLQPPLILHVVVVQVLGLVWLDLIVDCSVYIPRFGVLSDKTHRPILQKVHRETKILLYVVQPLPNLPNFELHS